MKLFHKLPILLLILLILTGCAQTKRPVTLIVANDLHFATETMMPKNTTVDRMMEVGDGKQLDSLQIITQAFLREVIELKPNAVLLNGDISYNGEAENHKALVEELQVLKEAGIPVYVIPGNHDIDSPTAQRVLDNPEGSIVAAENVTAEEFAEIYQDFMGTERDLHSLSYTVPLKKGLVLIMLDSAISHPDEVTSGGRIKPETMQWLEGQLERAKEKKQEVVVSLHHSTLIHSRSIHPNYTVQDHEELVALLQKYEVHFTLTGHIHIQNIKQDDGFTDIATGSLAVHGNNYGVLVWNPGENFSYTAQSTDVQAYIDTLGRSEDYLQDFRRHTFDTFSYSNFRRRAFRMFDNGLMDEEKVTLLAGMEGDAMAYIFPGTGPEYYDTIVEDPRWQEIIAYYGKDTDSIIGTVERAKGENMRYIEIELSQ